jgi:hypothetical protein
MTRTVIIVVVTVMMIMSVISVIIVWPAVTYSYIYRWCDIPAAEDVWIITPVIGRSVIWFIPSCAESGPIAVNRVRSGETYTKSAASINTYAPGKGLISVPVRVCINRSIIVENRV